MQVKLLRAIQEKKVRKVGATQEDPVDVRIISATHQKLAECVEAGKFRHDLYYRLNVIELRMPALREMREDVPHFVSALLDKLARHVGVQKPELTPEALEELKRYDFPGNVRELENVLERAMALCTDGKVTADDLQLTPEQVSGQPVSMGSDSKAPLQDYLDRVEKEAILEALEKTRYNRTAAAKLLGITFRSMRYRMERRVQAAEPGRSIPMATSTLPVRLLHRIAINGPRGWRSNYWWFTTSACPPDNSAGRKSSACSPTGSIPMRILISARSPASGSPAIF
jgi:two-component system, NtrC family, response regulator PilR